MVLQSTMGDVMGDRLRKGIALGMAGVALAAAVPSVAHAAPQEPVRIGILDMQASKVADQDANVHIVYREFNEPGAQPGRRSTPSGLDHGMVVATSAVRAVREIDRSVPIEIYAANAFQMAPDGKSYSMRYDKAMEALDWMHQQGVRVVVTSYNTKNMGGAMSLMNRAENLGMTVIAGASNVAGAGKVWPAADRRAISVADTTPNGSSLTLDPSVQEWVKFGFRGDYADRSKGGLVEDWGSSYSSAKVGGLAAYYQSRNPDAKHQDIQAALGTVAKPQVQKYGKVKATIAAVDAGGYVGRMRDVTGAGSLLMAQARSLGPVGTGAKGPMTMATNDALAQMPAVLTAGRDR